MRKLLITGGPVHAHIDDVKIVTNRFRGGLMAQLATQLAEIYPGQVVYLTAPGAARPEHCRTGKPIQVLEHKGFYDYQRLVLELAPECTDVILGAAVANLIPKDPLIGKFPSHNYQEGDVVQLDFLVTPRVITKVKAVAPHVNLIGFKLLSGAPHEELLSAAWHTLVSSRAAAVVANDTSDLLTKFVRTREGAVHEMSNGRLPSFLCALMQDEFYRTEAASDETVLPADEAKLRALLEHTHTTRPGLFTTTADGMVFGTAAVRGSAGGLWTTGRGKRELEDTAFVAQVDHDKRVVRSAGKKASLNAPLLESVFRQVPSAQAIVHGHCIDENLPLLVYAQPGTVADSQRVIKGSFNIDMHGCFYVLDAEGQPINWGA